ncbi:unnamed protein product, partial [Effrenium voratum]
MGAKLRCSWPELCTRRLRSFCWTNLSPGWTWTRPSEPCRTWSRSTRTRPSSSRRRLCPSCPRWTASSCCATARSLSRETTRRCPRCPPSSVACFSSPGRRRSDAKRRPKRACPGLPCAT